MSTLETEPLLSGDVTATALEAALAADDAVVVARDVTKRYGSGDAAVDALRGASVALTRGRFTAIMGPSGSGKSTLMHIMAGLDTPTSGSVLVDGIEITSLKEKQLTQLRRDKIGFIFQTFNLLPMLSARENVLLPLTIAGRQVDEDWLRSLIGTVGLDDRLSHRPSELSGGQQQRVAVARALVGKPAVLFADEPTGNLDSRTGEEVLGLLRHSVDELGQTIIMVTHDAHAASKADRVLFLKDGSHRLRPRPHGERRHLRRDPLAGARVMIRLALRSLAQHKLRTALTTIAILLGVAMISGTYVLTDQIDSGFKNIYDSAMGEIDAIITPKPAFGNALGGVNDTLSAATLAAVRKVDGVARAAGGAQALGAAVVDGKVVSTGGAPTLVLSDMGEQFNNVSLDRGLAAHRGSVAVDTGFLTSSTSRSATASAWARLARRAAGDHQRQLRLRLQGQARWAARSSSPAPLPTCSAGTTCRASSRTSTPRAQPGVSRAQLVADLRAALPKTVQVKTGAQSAADGTKAVSDALGSVLKPALLAFGGVALLVGAFIIFNTFSITVAQRQREFAMLRTLGASRRQVLGSVIAEALILGVAASVAGLFMGLGVAQGHERAVQGGRGRHPRRGLDVAAAHHRLRARHRHPGDAAGGRHPGPARHQGAAHRRAPARRPAAAVPLQPLHAGLRRPRGRGGRRRHSSRASSPTAPPASG